MAGEVKVIKNLWPAIKANLSLVKNSTVAVGFPSEKDKPHKGRSGLEGMTNAQVATANELGSAPGVKPAVPARPFMAQTWEREGARTKETLKALLKEIAEGHVSTKIALERIGRQYQGEIRRTFDVGTFAPNSKKTIRLKGSDQPLVDLGSLKKSVTYAVRMRSGNISHGWQTRGKAT